MPLRSFMVMSGPSKMAMARYDILSGHLSVHCLPFEPHVLEGEGVLRKIWVQRPLSAKNARPAAPAHTELLYRTRLSETRKSQFHSRIRALVA